MKRNMVCLLGLFLGVYLMGGDAARADENERPNAAVPVEITTDELPKACSGDEYSTHLSTRGGTGDCIFSSDSLPSFLTLSKSGELKGRMSAEPGEYRLTVMASDLQHPQNKAVKYYTLSIFPALEVVEKKIIPATVGRPYHETFTIQGGSGDRLITAEGLPEGLSMEENGELSGIPLGKPGSFPWFLIVKDMGPLKRTVRKPLELTVYPPISGAFQGPGAILSGSRYEASIKVSGGSGDYVFSSKDLPSGLGIDSSGLVMGMVNMKRGSYPFTVSVEDKKTGVAILEKQALSVVDFFPDPYESMNDDGFDTVNTVRPGSGVQTHTFDEPGDRDTVKLNFSAVAKDTVIFLELQNGAETPRVNLTLYDEDRTVIVRRHSNPMLPLFFKCQKPGLYYATLETSEGQTGMCRLGVHSMGKALEMTTSKLADVSRYTDSAQMLSASSGSGSYRYIPLDLPEGLTLDSRGLLSGRPSVAPGQYPVKIRVEDRLYPGILDDKEFMLTVVDFFPDEFEKLGDHDFSTGNTLMPGAAVQDHTFNTVNDEDVIGIDLREIPDNHVIHIRTEALSQATAAAVALYDAEKKQVTAHSGDDPAETSEVFFQKKTMDRVFARIKDRNSGTGQYRIRVTDLGPCVEGVKGIIPDALRRGEYSHRFAAEKGSGHYHFSSRNLPGNLIMDADGVMHGYLDLEPGSYPFTVTVEDQGFVGTGADMESVLTVVDYFPDRYEEMGDGNDNTLNSLSPGGAEQLHTFHQPGDVDVIRLDLSQCRTGDVIRVMIPGAAEGGALSVEILDPAGKSVAKAQRSDSKESLKMVYECTMPGILFIKASQPENRPGCYALNVDHCGPKLKLLESDLPIGESDVAYMFRVGIRGGNGKTVFSITCGSLPGGLELNPGSGEIKGKNKTWGKAVFTITAQDAQFPENMDSREFQMDTFMGKKLKGTNRVTFPHYVSGAFSWDENTCSTTAFPGRMEGGSPSQLRFRMLGHNIPADRFETAFDEKTGSLRISEKIPLSCKQYVDADLYADVQVEDSVYPNNTFQLRYDIPVRCLEY